MIKEGLTLGTKDKITLGKSKLYGDFQIRNLEFCGDFTVVADVSSVSDSLQSKIKAAMIKEIGHETEILDLSLCVIADNPEITLNDGDKRIRRGLSFETKIWAYIYDDVMDDMSSIEVPIDLTGYETELKEIILDGVKNFLQM